MNDDSLVDRLRKYDRLVLSVQMRLQENEALYKRSEEDAREYQQAVHDGQVLLANCGFALLFQDRKEQQYH